MIGQRICERGSGFLFREMGQVPRCQVALRVAALITGDGDIEPLVGGVSPQMPFTDVCRPIAVAREHLCDGDRLWFQFVPGSRWLQSAIFLLAAR